jgi:tetratricopeptide (TPR) repeat protein
MSTMKAASLIAIGMILSAVFVYAQTGEHRWEVASSEGLDLFQRGALAEADARFSAALQEAEQFGEQDPRLWSTISNLAMTRQERGDFSGAEKLMRRVLELRERYSAPHDQELAIELNNLAAVLHSIARDAEADPLLRRALTIVEEPAFSGDQRTRAAILNSLGLTLLNLGEKARAEPVLRRAVALFQASGGADSLDAAKALNNLAVLHRATHEFATAEQEFKQALPMYQQQLGDNHPQLIPLLGNLFSVLAEQKRFAAGEPYLRRAMEIADRNRGEISPASVLPLRVDLAALESSRGNYTGAAKILQGVIPDQERLLGPDHPQLAVTLENYAGVLRHLNQKAEAKRIDSRANAILKSFH